MGPRLHLPRALPAASLAAFAAVLLVACGDDGPDSAAVVTKAPVETPAGDDADIAGDVAEETAGAEPSGDAVEATGVVVPVVALDNTFRPQAIEIHVGDAVEWENRGINEHNVLSIEGDGWGVQVDDFQPGDVYRQVFSEPGEYAYFCSIHGNETVGMVGTVTVLP
jgi:plastocyanin